MQLIALHNKWFAPGYIDSNGLILTHLRFITGNLFCQQVELVAEQAIIHTRELMKGNINTTQHKHIYFCVSIDMAFLFASCLLSSYLGHTHLPPMGKIVKPKVKDKQNNFDNKLS